MPEACFRTARSRGFFFTLELEIAPSFSLLDDVSELVGEEVFAPVGVWLEGASPEEDVVTDGEGFGLDVASELVGARVVVDTNIAEIFAEARLHEGAYGGGEWLAARGAHRAEHLPELHARGGGSVRGGCARGEEGAFAGTREGRWLPAFSTGRWSPGGGLGAGWFFDEGAVGGDSEEGTLSGRRERSGFPAGFLAEDAVGGFVFFVVAGSAFGAGALDGGVAALFVLLFLFSRRGLGFFAGDERRALNGGHWARRREIRWIKRAHHLVGDAFGFELECVAGIAHLEVRVELLCVVRKVRRRVGMHSFPLPLGRRCFRLRFRGGRFRLP
jgi:hypothetical protein